MEDYFVLDKRLGIKTPVFNVEWDDLPLETQQSILLHGKRLEEQFLTILPI